MIQFIARSATFRTLMADLFSGAQNYSSLKRRLWTQFGMTLSEVLASLLRPRTSLGEAGQRGRLASNMTDISAGDLLKPGLTGRYEADVRPEWTRAH